jgi:hypothetical protein
MVMRLRRRKAALRRRDAVFVLDNDKSFRDVKHMITKTFIRALFVSSALSLVAAAYAADSAGFSGLEAAKHIGETATVTDKVESAYQAKGGNIFLNMGGRHPDETFTVFVPASSASEFKDIKIYDGKTISVTGKIEDHKGKPQISVKSPSEITIKSDAGAATPSSTATAAASPTLSAFPSASVSP